ncbi:chromate efflux transporter [Polycladidibacter stylochi]|uniref:chromate efflux transporter n=1 Tax=Polycladidibacter stylochi TaxID=1807766 RepID=UPI00156B7CD1|nr:chromate efflux transporter [Pseudovibrio stylochi]
MDKTKGGGLVLLEIVLVFLRLGLTSFGGPVAHLGYFREEFVTRRRWLDDASYGDLVALCQFLPGPASSQVGFAIGLLRGGWYGAILAFVGFTLPSAILMIGFAFGAVWLDGPFGIGLIHGLKLVAVAVVAHAVWGMAQKLCPDWQRSVIALISMLVLALVGSALTQVLVIAVGALIGWWMLSSAQQPSPVHETNGPERGLKSVVLMLVFVVLLIGLPIMADTGDNNFLALVSGFYQSGALVFGGGHVVLPLLEVQTVATQRLSEAQFLAGYGVAQAVPGPLFTFAGYLGAVGSYGLNATAAGLWALFAVFLPGFLLVGAALPYWQELRVRQDVQGILAGANAAVVGVLAFALYDPLWTSTINSKLDFVVAAAGFVMLSQWKMPAYSVVVILGGAGLAMSLL